MDDRLCAFCGFRPRHRGLQVCKQCRDQLHAEQYTHPPIHPQCGCSGPEPHVPADVTVFFCPHCYMPMDVQQLDHGAVTRVICWPCRHGVDADGTAPTGAIVALAIRTAEICEEGDHREYMAQHFEEDTA